MVFESSNVRSSSVLSVASLLESSNFLAWGPFFLNKRILNNILNFNFFVRLLRASATLWSAPGPGKPAAELQWPSCHAERLANERIMLRNINRSGMSLFWSQWDPKYWNAQTLQQLKCKWRINVVGLIVCSSFLKTATWANLA